MGVWRRAELVGQGFSDHQLRRLCSDGELHRVSRGVYLDGPVPDDAVTAHALRVRGVMARLERDVVVSHESAAVLHAMRIWGLDLTAVRVTAPRRRSGGRRSQDVHLRVARLDPRDIVVLDGLPVTSVERTLVDVARCAPYEAALVLADGVLADARTDRVRLEEIAAALRGRPGVVDARRVLATADGRSGSAGETRSRVAMLRAGLPTPQLQLEVVLPGGRRAFADFGWPERATLGEFDGRVKYGRLLRPGEDAGDAVFREKLREDALRAEGWSVVRWTWHDLTNFTPTAARLAARLSDAQVASPHRACNRGVVTQPVQRRG